MNHEVVTGISVVVLVFGPEKSGGDWCFFGGRCLVLLAERAVVRVGMDEEVVVEGETESSSNMSKKIRCVVVVGGPNAS